MSEWITGRRPTSDDADKDGMVLTHEVGSTYWGCVSSLWHWMKRPPLPVVEPPARTLEDVVRDYLDSSNWSEPWSVSCWRNEMREILERGDK